jgi:hypothetical protein
MTESSPRPSEDLQGDPLVQSVLNNESFVKDAIDGFAQIEAGENTVFTLEQLRESIANDQLIV